MTMRLKRKDATGRRGLFGLLLGGLLAAMIWLPAGDALPQVLKARPMLPETPGGVKPQLVTGGSVSLTANPASVSFNLQQGGTANGTSTVSITTSWNSVTGVAV